MKRLFLLLAAVGVGGAAWRWLRGGPSVPGDAATSPSANAPEVPPLGGDVSEELLAILACPDDKQPVKRVGNFLVCEKCQRHFPIRDGIPVMLLDEALTPEQARAAS